MRVGDLIFNKVIGFGIVSEIRNLDFIVLYGNDEQVIFGRDAKNITILNKELIDFVHKKYSELSLESFDSTKHRTLKVEQFVERNSMSYDIWFTDLEGKQMIMMDLYGIAVCPTDKSHDCVHVKEIIKYLNENISTIETKYKNGGVLFTDMIVEMNEMFDLNMLDYEAYKKFFTRVKSMQYLEQCQYLKAISKSKLTTDEKSFLILTIATLSNFSTDLYNEFRRTSPLINQCFNYHLYMPHQRSNFLYQINDTVRAITNENNAFGIMVDNIISDSRYRREYQDQGIISEIYKGVINHFTDYEVFKTLWIDSIFKYKDKYYYGYDYVKFMDFTTLYCRKEILCKLIDDGLVEKIDKNIANKIGFEKIMEYINRISASYIGDFIVDYFDKIVAINPKIVIDLVLNSRQSALAFDTEKVGKAVGKAIDMLPDNEALKVFFNKTDMFFDVNMAPLDTMYETNELEVKTK